MFGVLVLRLMLVAMPSPAAAPKAVLIPICTAEGLKWLPFDSKAPDKPIKASIDCPLCVAAQGFSLLVPVVAMPVPPQATCAAEFAFHRTAPTLRIAARPPPSRGPPVLSASEAETRSL